MGDAAELNSFLLYQTQLTHALFIWLWAKTKSKAENTFDQENEERESRVLLLHSNLRPNKLQPMVLLHFPHTNENEGEENAKRERKDLGFGKDEEFRVRGILGDH